MWVTRTITGIVLATLFSDFGHEMATAVLPLYLGSVGLGTAALGTMEGAADLAKSLSKLAGGVIGHRIERKHRWVTLGYVVTMLGVGAIALVRSFVAVVSFRTVAWIGRGFRSPMRDFMLSDEVDHTQYGRAYGFERTADMVGAVLGPGIAALLVWLDFDFQTVILISVIPAGLAVLSFGVLGRDRTDVPAPAPTPTPTSEDAEIEPSGRRLPRTFWLFSVGVLLFGLGDFSRTFLIVLVAAAIGYDPAAGGQVLTVAVLLYAAHNLVSAFAAYPAGRLGDRFQKSRVLVFGYALGAITNGMLAIASGSLTWVIVAIALSGIYIAIEETLEKAVVAQVLPREQRTLGLGILASVNAIGDLGSSVFVGAMLATGHHELAFAIPAGVGVLGAIWMAVMSRRTTV